VVHHREMAGPKRGTAAGPSPRPESVTRRPVRPIAGRAAVGGLIGPAAFVGAWALGGALKDGYSPTNDAISRLAAIGASTRPLMTSGFVCFGVAVPVYALALRRRLGGPAWVAAASTGFATLAVAAVPLGMSSTGDLVHGALATAGYVTLTATPVLAGGTLWALGRRSPAAVSWAIGASAGLCLAATLLGSHHGLWQRAGLSVGDAWLAASAVAMLLRSPPAAQPIA
jgi:hypothetical membrane protein